MLLQTQGNIYLAEQRGCTQLEDYFRSFHIFNSGTYYREDRKSLANLLIFNDETLKENTTINVKVQENVMVILIPIVGVLSYKTKNQAEKWVEVGQVQFFSMPKDAQFEITNPYQDKLINFLQIQLVIDNQVFIEFTEETEFDLETNSNQLIPISPLKDTFSKASIYIGKYEGRAEELYQLKNNRHKVFVFVIEGAFEVQNRLLQPRDGLALWDLETLDFEALSNNAIILVLELET